MKAPEKLASAAAQVMVRVPWWEAGVVRFDAGVGAGFGRMR